MRFRKVLERFEPYEWETPSGDIAAKLGLAVDQIIRFDTNASPNVPSKWLRDLSSKLDKIGINDYPDTSYLSLRKALSEYINVPVDRITVTNGSDEGLDLLIKTFIDVGSKAVVSAPTYSYYRTITQTAGGDIVPVPRLKNFSDDIEGLIKAAKREDSQIVFLCSPNNPTGNSSKREDIIQLLEGTDVAVAVDEAYSEFSGKTLVDLTNRYDNLIVLRTFSKAFALAGARVGYTVASKSTLDLINKVRPPNSLSVISLALAELAANDLDTMKKNVKIAVQERDRCRKFIVEQLKDIQVYPSETNFLLLRFEKIDPNKVHKELMRRGLIVRNVSKTTGLEKCLRFSIRLPKQNDLLLNALSEIVKNS